jgi:hypothetical protein
MNIMLDLRLNQVKSDAIRQSIFKKLRGVAKVKMLKKHYREESF